MMLAGKQGSLPMVMILDYCAAVSTSALNANEIDTFFRLATKSGNLDLFRWLLNAVCKVSDRRYTVLAGEAFGSDSHEIYEEWENFLLDASRQLSWRIGVHTTNKAVHGVPAKLKVAFSNTAFYGARKGAMFEARLIRTWDRLTAEFDCFKNPRYLGHALVALARSACKSTTLAAELLRLGAAIDYPHKIVASESSAGTGADITTHHSGPKSTSDSDLSSEDELSGGKSVHVDGFRRNGRTALHVASQGTTERAARFVKFLLEEGADPTYGHRGVEPAQEKGAKTMRKWLGESWEDLVARTEPARGRRKQLHCGPGNSRNDRGRRDESDGKSPKAKRPRTGRRRARVADFHSASDDE
jgi:hypothetical protein